MHRQLVEGCQRPGGPQHEPDAQLRRNGRAEIKAECFLNEDSICHSERSEESRIHHVDAHEILHFVQDDKIGGQILGG